MIRYEGVCKRYGSKTILKDLSFTVAKGELAVLLGPSGCGKSTSLRMANRMVEPEVGRVLVDGADVRLRDPIELRRSMGYVIQQVGLFPHRNVAENIETVPTLLGWKAARRRARSDELLELVGLDPASYRDRYPARLSGGEAQRVGVARALAVDPPILLMDEPFGAVDPLTRETLQREFKALRARLGTTVLFVTHDLDEAIRLADRILLLRDGRLVQNDTPETLLAAPADRFVRDFVGADRALRRLARFLVSASMKAAPACGEEERIDAELKRRARAEGGLWVLGQNGWLRGRLSAADLDGGEGGSVLALMRRVRPVEEAVRPDASLREALARMLGQGLRRLAVVDADWRLVGELDFETIANIAGEGDYSW